MQQARELTPAEIAEGQRHISSQQLTATQIQALVRAMDNSKTKWRRLRNKKPEYEAKLKAENEVLYFNYPSLFQMHMEDRLDATFFEMLALKRKIEQHEITAEQASALVGQKLFNRYVPHVLTNQPPAATVMSYQDYYKAETQSSRDPATQ